MISDGDISDNPTILYLHGGIHITFDTFRSEYNFFQLVKSFYKNMTTVHEDFHKKKFTPFQKANFFTLV